MKKFTLLIFFFLICSLLSAQNTGEIKIFVPPVSGEGRAGDSNFFYQQLTYEVIYNNHSLVRSLSGSDFTLRGAISPEAAARSQNYVFYLEMTDSNTNAVIAHQSIIYAVIGSNVIELISAMVYNMLSTVPSVRKTNDWRDNHLYVGARAIWQPRLYLAETGNQSINAMNFGVGFTVDYHFRNFMALSGGLQFSQDWLMLSETATSTVDYRDLIIEIPVAVKFSFKPGNIMLEPYTGIAFNFSINRITKPSLLSWIIGLQFNFNVGPGSIVIDPRFALDFFPSVLHLPQTQQNVQEMLYNRYTVQIGIGYRFGFIPKRVRDY